MIHYHRMGCKLNLQKHVQIFSVSQRNKPLFCPAEKRFSPNMFSSSTCSTSAIESIYAGNLIYHL